VRARHVFEVDRLSIFVQKSLSVSGIIPEAVFHTYDNPNSQVRHQPSLSGDSSRRSRVAVRVVMKRHAHQRFVKTTPKPRATKNSNGELVALLLLLLLFELLFPGFPVGFGWFPWKVVLRVGDSTDVGVEGIDEMEAVAGGRDEESSDDVSCRA
jgi:hypothetical protein